MLYPDAKRRMKDIEDMARLFEEKGYLGTSKEVLSFAKILEGRRIPPNFMKKLYSLLNLFHREFVRKLKVGQTYRNRCCQEIKDIILQAVAKTYPDFSQIMVGLYPFIKRISHGRRILGNIAEWLTPTRIPDKELRVHLACYAYLITVEGLFDELARMLYFFIEVSNGNVLSVQDLEKVTVWVVLEKVRPTPVFLQNWDEKRHIRNAIGHARVYYYPAHAEIHFIDKKVKRGKVKVTYDETLSMTQFFEMALELEDSVMAFSYIIIMLRLHDLILSKNAY